MARGIANYSRGIANYANDFNKVRDDVLDSAYQNKNRMRADYIADYNMPNMMNYIDSQNYLNMQNSLANQYGLQPNVTTSLANSYVNQQKALQNSQLYNDRANDFYEALNANLTRDRNNANANMDNSYVNFYKGANNRRLYEENPEAIYGISRNQLESGVNNSLARTSQSDVNLQQVEAQRMYDQARRDAQYRGNVSDLSQLRDIDMNATPEMRSNPYFLQKVTDERRKAELANANVQAALGISPTAAPQYFGGQFEYSYNPQYNQSQVYDRSTGNTYYLPGNVATNNIINALYGNNPQGLNDSQKAINDALIKRQDEASRAQANQYFRSLYNPPKNSDQQDPLGLNSNQPINSPTASYLINGTR